MDIDAGITESATAVVSSTGLVPLTQGAGYFGGNQSNYATIQRLDLANATNGNTSASLAVARSSATGIASEYFGYFVGGNSGSVSAEIDGIDFITEAAINPSATMPTGTQQSAGAANYSRGMVAGGQPASGIPVATVQSFLFNSMSRTQLSGSLAKARYDFSGISGTTNGYFAGGVDASFISQTEIDGVTFSGAITNTASVLTGARYGVATLSSPATSGKGYFCGGTNGSRFSRINSLLFATEAMTVESYTLAVARSQAGGVQSPVQGFICGGSTGSNSYEIDGIDFTTGTATNPSATMATSVLYSAAVSARQFGILSVDKTEAATASESLVGDYVNSKSQDEPVSASVLQNAIANAKYADIVATTTRESRSLFFCGGLDYPGDPNIPYGALAHISRIDTFSDTYRSAGGALSLPRHNSAAGASSAKGYIIAGSHPIITTDYTTTDAMQFSDETVTAIAASMPYEQSGVSASTSTTATYVRGSQGVSYYEKLTFATETFSEMSWYVPVSKGYSTALDSATKGYCCGGVLNSGGTNTSQIDAIVFATDTSATVSAALPYAYFDAGGIFSSEKGYLVGGGTAGSNIVSSFDFATESAADLGAMTDVVTKTAGASSSTHGYVTGGRYANGDVLGLVRKLSFSTESFVTNGATIRPTNSHCGFASPGVVVGCTDVLSSRVGATRDVVETASADVAILGIVAGILVEQATAADTVDTLGMVIGALQHEFAWLRSFTDVSRPISVSFGAVADAMAQQSGGFYFSDGVTAQSVGTASQAAFAVAVVNQAAAATADVLNAAMMGKMGVRLEPTVAVTLSSAAQSGGVSITEVVSARSVESVIADFKAAIYEAVSAWVSVRLDPASLDLPHYSVTIKTKTGAVRVFTGREVAIVTRAISGDKFVSIDQESAHVR